LSLHRPGFTPDSAYPRTARPVQRHDRTRRSAHHARLDTGDPETYVLVYHRCVELTSEHNSSWRNCVLQQQHPSLRCIHFEHATGDIACLHGGHTGRVCPCAQYTTARSRMDERGRIPGDVDSRRKAYAQEISKDARGTSWQRYRILIGGIDSHRSRRN
jgi:hypothetical protein